MLIMNVDLKETAKQTDILPGERSNSWQNFKEIVKIVIEISIDAKVILRLLLSQIYFKSLQIA